MPEYLSPGVYIEEIELGTKPIEGVSTSTAGFLGEAERGPTVPRFITSFLEYQRVFGSFFGSDKFLPHAVQGFFQNGGQRVFIGRIVNSGATPASLILPAGTGNALTVEALGEGTWGNRIALKVSQGTFNSEDNPLFRLDVFYWKEEPADLYDPDVDKTTKPRPVVTENFDNLSIIESSPDFYEKKVNGISNLIKLFKDTTDSGETPEESSIVALTGGTDGGDIRLADYERLDTDAPGKRKGLTAFKAIDEISIVYAPDAQAVIGLVSSLIIHCENIKDRFAIIDSQEGQSDISTIDPRSANDTKYGAFYYPWVKVVDPEAGLLRLVPPGGYMAGIYARTDIERGVHKAPANEVVRGVTDLEFQITSREQDILNPRGVNVIRAFPGRGIRVWGARTLSSDSLWKYINVRRLFIFLEESIDEGTQGLVFEPNNERLWAIVKRTITEFLTRVWRDGALMGTKPEEAFFVKADRTTMTQDDIDNGRLIVLIGVAPVKPAEFVIFRIAQVPGGSTITEG